MISEIYHDCFWLNSVAIARASTISILRSIVNLAMALKENQIFLSKLPPKLQSFLLTNQLQLLSLYLFFDQSKKLLKWLLSCMF
jgi:hypothetical protein